MEDIVHWSDEELFKVRIVLADIDDTMTSEGVLPSTSLSAMERLQSVGIKIVPVTGRPAGWCDHIARMWPVDAVVGENGALYMTYDRVAKSMHYGFAKTSEQERQSDRGRLDNLAREILSTVPGAGIASDQPYRLADLAIDFCEDVDPLPLADVERIVQMFEAAGATAKVSSIHVNGWFGDYDKLTMTKRLFVERFGVNLDQDRHFCTYIGDSPNDQPMFDFFENSVGVANVRDFELDQPPRWVTQGRSADGFAELAQRLLDAQR